MFLWIIVISIFFVLGLFLGNPKSGPRVLSPWKRSDAYAPMVGAGLLLLLTIWILSLVWRMSDYIWAFVLGAAVGAGELLVRYSDSPDRPFRKRPGLEYIAVNGAASLAVLFLIRVYDWQLPFTVPANNVPADPANAGVLATRTAVTQILVAGGGALTLLRSSLVLRWGDKDYTLGFSGLLQVLLNATDREVDRLIAQDREEDIGELDVTLSFDQVAEALPAYCLTLMQNISEPEKAALRTDIDAIRDGKFEEPLKKRLLLLRLSRLCGPLLLKDALDRLMRDVKSAALVKDTAAVPSDPETVRSQGNASTPSSVSAEVAAS